MGKHRLVAALGASTGVFAAAFVGVTTYLIYDFYKGRELKEDGTQMFKCPQNPNEFRTRYRGYFVTDDDLSKLKQMGEESLRPVVNESNWMPNVTSTQNSTNTTTAPGRKRRQANSVGYCASNNAWPRKLFHACCVSYTSLVDPSTLPSGEPGNHEYVTIYQPPGYKQYFTISNCCQVKKCAYRCRCTIVSQRATAVVVMPNSRGTVCSFQFVLVPNCCVCLNN